MRVGVVGINHKLADLKLRDQLAKTCQRRFGASQSFHESQHFVLLSTCNRTEIYFSSEDLAYTHSYLLGILRAGIEEEFDHKLYSYFGSDCFCHLTRVTSGLDSAIVAETEIQGQVKIAYENTTDYHLLPKELHFLFQKSLGIAKKVRSDLQLGRGMPHLEHAILQIGYQLLASPTQAKILFVGASEINRKIFSFLKIKQFQHLTLCNRSDEQAKQWADEYTIHLLEWKSFSQWTTYDWIIFGTKSPNYLIHRFDVNLEPTRKQLIMDLSVPRNVEPQLAQHPQISLFNIDQLNRLLKARHGTIDHTLIEADRRIVEATQQHAKRYLEKEQLKTALLMVSA
jgi:glutamyl-tRNA reductase